MSEKKHFPHAPIKEALIDIQTAFPNKITAETLNSKYAQIAQQYSQPETIQQDEVVGLFSEGGLPSKVTVEHTVTGYRYRSKDGHHVVQFRTDGFTFSRLEPYDTWEQMKAEAAKLWDVYVEAVSPSLVTRVGARYVNELKLPLTAKLEDYLETPPKIPGGLNQELGGFFARINISEPEIKAQGFLIQAMEGIFGNHLPVFLDIDVFMTKQFELGTDDFWPCFEQLRALKNKVFLKSITKKAEELFQ